MSIPCQVYNVKCIRVKLTRGFICDETVPLEI